MTTPTAVIVLAAGAGTRMKSSLPKVVHPVVGRSMIGHALHAAAGTHPDHLVAVVRHQRELVAAEILRNNPDVIIADQDDIPGTGRAVQCALDELLRSGHSLSGTILVTYGDVPMLDADTLNALVRSHDERGATVSVLTTIVDDPTGYGRIIRDETSGDVCRIVEQKDASEAERQIREINAGIYAFDGEFLRDALMHVGTNNNQGEVYLTDV
ncbi:MAG: NTP transferase domain-containing protein, partial [Actinomyces sp.]|nr:NTP transferase domain-containing protein [Actinomyces sp.]